MSTAQVKSRSGHAAQAGNTSQASLPAQPKPSAPSSVEQNTRNESVLARFLDAHKHTLAYGITGIAVAVLILIAGFWPTALVVVLAALGLAIGRYRDGDSRMFKTAQAMTTRMRHRHARK